jgi:hypothetical protein
MTNILLFAILFLLILVCGVSAYFLFKLSRIIRAFIIPTGESEPSPLAKTIDAASIIVARSLVAQLKTTFMGKQSGEVRGEHAVQGDMALDVANQSPLGSILTAFPSLGKSMRRNPQLLDLAMGVASKYMGKVSTGGNGSSSSQPKFKL